MLTIFFRTIIIYIFLIGTMRLLGKRQLGELEISELITTILLSEIASLPITNQDIPVLYAIIPLITIITFEISTSLLLSKFPKLKGALSSRPSMLIKNGKIDQKELLKNRISNEELISELRQKNITDLKYVEYAILEQNGLLSVIPKACYQQPTAKQLKVVTDENGIMHIIISQGKWNEFNLQLLGKEKTGIENYLEKQKVKINDVFLLLMDDGGNYNLIVTEKEK